MTLTNSSTAFWITGKGTAELQEASLAAPLDNEVRVRTLFSGVSRGTELLVYTGQIPPSEHERMRAPFQDGSFPFPVKYGYMNVGHVERGPDHLVGKTVFSLFPHQTHFNLPAQSVTPVPEGVPASRAVLTANMETAINALWDALPSIGDKISVIGAGVLGCLVAYLAARITGCKVQLIDVNPERATIADALGLTFTAPESASANQDLVIHTSATEQGLNRALELAGFEATVLELSWFGNKTASIRLGGAFHSQRLHIKCSQVGHVATQQRARWTYQRRLQLALAHLNDPCLDALISGESHFRQLPETFNWLNEPGNGSLCHRISYD